VSPLFFRAERDLPSFASMPSWTFFLPRQAWLYRARGRCALLSHPRRQLFDSLQRLPELPDALGVARVGSGQLIWRDRYRYCPSYPIDGGNRAAFLMSTDPLYLTYAPFLARLSQGESSPNSNGALIKPEAYRGITSSLRSAPASRRGAIQNRQIRTPIGDTDSSSLY